MRLKVTKLLCSENAVSISSVPDGHSWPSSHLKAQGLPLPLSPCRVMVASASNFLFLSSLKIKSMKNKIQKICIDM